MKGGYGICFFAFALGLGRIRACRIVGGRL